MPLNVHLPIFESTFQYRYSIFLKYVSSDDAKRFKALQEYIAPNLRCTKRSSLDNLISRHSEASLKLCNAVQKILKMF